ncbi:CIS tube protein [Nitrospirillum iridis]|uniref:LysM domain-containing protein n=1 Tax=Nitrospirillum iridis TaxID=765888 RepID=A0A7X0AX83_9PROT|nr:LysM peptidoglycan-binding domain-containing protein [Nitrospirillum iridis]MBB6250765.1 hypothetical protein [Nitrospirillum iridis]
MAGSLEKMIVTAYSDQNFTTQVGDPYTVWINPASYRYKYSIYYNDRQAQGSNGASPDFNRSGPDSVAFELVFDATGVVPSPVAGQADAPADGITSMVNGFKALVLKFNGNIHSPNYVMLSWGMLQFGCRLQSMDINYTLFRPDGTPLRARMSVSFLGFTSESQLAKQANKRSPDMTHIVTVVAGDSLPTLCKRIYGSSLHYLRVAEFNKLNTFKQLIPGTQLLFPPLAKTAP